MMPSIHITLIPSVDIFEQTKDMIIAFGQTTQITPKHLFQFSVCVTEALNNILEHSEAQIERVHLDITIEPSRLSVVIKQKAQAFTPPHNDFTNILAISGRGWSIMREWLDTIEYTHKNGVNILTLAKNVSL